MSRNPKQMRLPVRMYRVSGMYLHSGVGFHFETQAATPGSAKWRTFKAVNEAGYFKEGFRSFLLQRLRVREVRR